MSTLGAERDPRVLSIQSHVVSGYVGNKCAVFPLQVLGLEVDFVNSVQLSNHTGYGKWFGQVLTDKDLEDLFKGISENDLCHYNYLLTGYVGAESFLRAIRNVVTDVKKENPGCIYLCDPVLGDNGKFYVPQSLIPIYQNEILPLADITTPNTFELELLSGMKVTNESEAVEAMDKLHDKGISIVILTSLDSEGSELSSYVSVKSNEKGREVYKVMLPRLQGIFTGTGDFFAALFLGWYHKLGRNRVPEVLETALATMEVVLSRTKAKADERAKILQNVATPIAAGHIRPNELQLVQSLDVIMKPTVSRKVVKVAI